jgi:hypothetical protein
MGLSQLRAQNSDRTLVIVSSTNKFTPVCPAIIIIIVIVH